MTPPTPLTTALEALRDLTPEQINVRLDELAAEEAQLRVLLRASVARERARRATPVEREVAHAS